MRCYTEKGNGGGAFAESKARRARLPGGSESNWLGTQRVNLLIRKSSIFSFEFLKVRNFSYYELR
jgi:hypothetical protein